MSRFWIGVLDAVLCFMYLYMALENPEATNGFMYAICILCWGACSGMNFYIWYKEKKIKERQSAIEKMRFEVENKIY